LYFLQDRLVMLSYKVYNPPSVESKKMLPGDVREEASRRLRLPESVMDECLRTMLDRNPEILTTAKAAKRSIREGRRLPSPA
jgi:hypothetical protein